jgi:O-antigen ligase
LTQNLNFKISLITHNYFILLFAFFPISIIAGSTISLINILLIDISFVVLLLIRKEYSFIANKNFKYLVLLYFYLIFNTFISYDFSLSAPRNFGFIRMIILFLAINYFFNVKFFFKKIFLLWTLFFLIILIDVFYEAYNGHNILGFISPYEKRIVSFFKDEPVIGGFIAAFFLILIGFFSNEYKKYKILISIIAIIFILSILITGERSNFLKSLFGIIIFYFFYKEFSLKFKSLIIIFLALCLSIVLFNSNFLQNRFIHQIKEITQDKEGNDYFRLQKSGLEVANEKKFFGVGNKNYRIATCITDKETALKERVYFRKYCSTHPHQIYVEFLSEHGFFGFILLFFIFNKMIFSKIRQVLNSNNYISLGAFCYLIFTFTPIIPSGAFFSDFSLTLFFINFSIFYASNPNLNLFCRSAISKTKSNYQLRGR